MVVICKLKEQCEYSGYSHSTCHLLLENILSDTSWVVIYGLETSLESKMNPLLYSALRLPTKYFPRSLMVDHSMKSKDHAQCSQTSTSELSQKS